MLLMWTTKVRQQKCDKSKVKLDIVEYLHAEKQTKVAKIMSIYINWSGKNERTSFAVETVWLMRVMKKKNDNLRVRNRWELWYLAAWK